MALCRSCWNYLTSSIWVQRADRKLHTDEITREKKGSTKNNSKRSCMGQPDPRRQGPPGDSPLSEGGRKSAPSDVEVLHPDTTLGVELEGYTFK